MPKSFQDLSLTYKILLADLLCLAAFAALWWGVLSHFTGVQERTQALRAVGDRIPAHVLEAQRWEKDFLLWDLSQASLYETGTSEHLDKRTASLQALDKEIATLAPFVKDGSIPKETTDELKRLAEKYERRMVKLVSALRQRGYKGYGFIDRWTKASGALEAEAARAKRPALRTTLEELVKLGRDALAEGDLQTMEKALRQAEGLLAAARDGPSDRALLSALDDYEAALVAAAALQKELGSNQHSGLRGEVRAAAGELEAIAKSARQQALEADESAKTGFRRMAAAGGAAGFVLAVVLAVPLAKRLTKRLKASAAAAHAAAEAKGQRPRLEVDGLDETGRILESFNRLVDELNRSGEAVAAGEARHAAMLNSLAHGLIAADGAGRIEFMNPTAAQLTGFVGDARGKPAADVFRITDRVQKQPLEDPFAAAARSRAASAPSDPVLLVSKTAETAILYACSPILDAAGAMHGVVLAFQDVTRLEKVMKTLQENERLYHQMVDASSEMFWMAEASFEKFLFAGPSFEMLWGRRRQELLGNPAVWWEGIHPEDRDRVRETMQAKVLSGEAHTLEFRLAKADGSVRRVEAKTSPVKNFKGQIYRACGLVREVTDREAAAAAPEPAPAAAAQAAAAAPPSAADPLAAVFRAYPDAVFVTDFDGIVQAANPAAARLLGWDEAELKGMPAARLIPADRGQELAQVLKFLSEGFALEDYPTVRLRKDGAQVAVTVSSFPLLDAAGKPAAACQVARLVPAPQPAASRPG